MNASLALVQPEYADFGKCQMLMFLVNVNLCLYFVLWRACECVWVCVCVCMYERGCVCQLHDLQCVSVMSCGMLQSHVHGPVT